MYKKYITLPKIRKNTSILYQVKQTDLVYGYCSKVVIALVI